MGSLVSAPKPPARPEVIYVPQSVGGGSSSGSSGSPASSQGSAGQVGEGGASGSAANAGSETGEEEDQARARVASLLQRNRGRLGTVLTGLSGVLAPGDATPRRKQLLGE